MVIQLPSELKGIIKNIELALINKNYKKFSSEKARSRLSSKEISTALKEYLKITGFTKLTPAPDESYKNLKVILIEGIDPKKYHIDFGLWFDGKQSDLTLQTIIQKDKTGKYIASIVDIHVL